MPDNQQEAPKKLERFYITRHSLTKGIIEKEGSVNPHDNDCLIVQWNGFKDYIYGSDWHRHKESAVQRAKEMKKLKLTYLLAQVKRIKNLRFD